MDEIKVVKSEILKLVNNSTIDMLEKLIEISNEPGMNLELFRWIMQDFKSKLE